MAYNVATVRESCKMSENFKKSGKMTEVSEKVLRHPYLLSRISSMF